MPAPLSLPIDPTLPQIVDAVRARGAVVVEAPPGAGKTTRVPRALLDAGVADTGEIIVLQPRRLPTRLSAERVAEELGEQVGHTVGYTVRFEDVASSRTRVRFVTEGVLTRRILSDPDLRGVSAVVLDEFHERHLATDLALGLLRQLRASRRRDLCLVAMSATLDAAPIAEFLDRAPIVTSEGRRFDVSIDHLDREDDRPLSDQIVGAVRRLLQEGVDGNGLKGDVLVFLPGAGEIRRAATALQALAERHELLVLPLHGDLPLAEQNKAVRRAPRRKIILSTNVAETSVTIEGVVAVVDSGVARVASHSPWSGLPVLKLAPISQASAVQRAGRAGRTQAGRALRLYTKHDLDGRRSYDLPEVARMDLSEAALALHALGVSRPANWGWFESPPVAALTAAESLLQRLDAVDGGGLLTEVGRRMLRHPVHPRLARILVEAERHDVGDAAAAVVAILAERDIRQRARVSMAGQGPRPSADADASADVFEVLDLYEQAAAANFAAPRLRSLDLEPRAVEGVRKAARQLSPRGTRKEKPASLDARDRALARALLSGFVDRVGKRRGGEVVLSGGGAAAIGPAPAADLIVVLDAQESEAGRGRTVARVRLAAPIAADWLIDLAATEVVEEDVLAWNAQTERVDRISRLRYGAVVLDETRRPAEPSAEASRLLQEAARAAGAEALGDAGALAALKLRLDLLRTHVPELGVPEAPAATNGGAEDGGADTLALLCEGRTSFVELRQADVVSSVLAALPAAVAGRLPVDVPLRVRLPGGREVPVHYEADRPPWIESRLQDFFGMAEGPKICRSRVPLVLHLLAPNGRAVQVTRDLANFWRQHYPPLRKELGRRYPRHAWPEDGATATPPEPRRPRGG